MANSGVLIYQNKCDWKQIRIPGQDSMMYKVHVAYRSTIKATTGALCFFY